MVHRTHLTFPSTQENSNKSFLKIGELLSYHDHRRNGLAKVERAVGHEPPLLRVFAAADFRRDLARIGPERAAGAGGLVAAWSTKTKVCTGT